MVCPSCIACTTSSLTAVLLLPIPNSRGPRTPRASLNSLEAGDVLRLKAFRALLHFKFHRLTLIQRLITVHLNCREVYEYIFPGLALDEPVALRSIEPLHCSLFLHC